MKTLTSTLLAAQKKPHRLPYVEAKVYDYEAGIKRLTWTRLYTGTEPDNHHGIAFAWSARYSLRWNYTAFQPWAITL